MAEVQVQGWGTSAAPNDRTTKDSERLEVVALEATFDGSGAAAAFVPTVQIISDSGAEVGAFPLSGSLAAGDSATVTFAPFLGRNGGAASSVNGGLGLYLDHNHNVPSGFTELAAWNYTQGSPLLDVSGANLTLPVILTSGVYAVTACAVTFAPVAGAIGLVTCDGNSAAGVDNFGAQTFPLGDAGSGSADGTAAWTGFMAAGDTLDLTVVHDAGADVLFDLFANVQLLKVT